MSVTRWTWSFLVVLGGVVAGLLAWLFSWAFDLGRGDLPSWFGAVGTVLVLLIGVAAYNNDLSQRRKADAERELREQAALVDA